MSFRLRLLGCPELWQDGRALELPTRKLWALLAYLALEGPQDREALAGLLWEGERARANLRRELVRLRQTGLELEEVEGQLRFSLQSDVAEFLQHLSAQRYAQALALWRGILLEGLTFAEPPLEEWLELTRARLEAQYEEALLQRGLELLQAGALAQAIAPLSTLLQRDPWNEEGLGGLLRALAGLGQPAEALRRYQAYAKGLKAELGLAPSAGMAGLVRAIQEGRPLPPLPGQPRVALGHPPLVGRGAAWRALTWATAPAVLLLGEAGVGKSRLVQEFVQTQPVYRFLNQVPQDEKVVYGGLAASLRRLWEEGERFVGLAEAWRLEAARLVPELAEAPPNLSEAEAPLAPARFREGLAQALLHGLKGGWLVWEDVHYADAASLEFLPYLVRRAQAQGVRLLLTARPEAEPRLGPWLQDLERDRLLERLSLTPLDEAATLELIRRASGMPSGGVRFAQRLHRATGGNPLFLVKVLESLFAEGLLWADTQGWHTPFDQETEDYRELPLPQSLQEEVVRRLEALEGLGVARLLALSPRPLPLARLQSLLGEELLRLQARLDALVRAGLVAADLEGYRLGHELFRQAVLGTLGPERTGLHLLLAQNGEKEERLYHLEAAHLFQEAWPLAQGLAEAALGRQAFAQAEGYARRALEAFQQAPGRASEEAGLLLLLEQARMLLSRPAEQAPLLERLQALAPLLTPAEQAEVAFRRVRFLAMQGRWAEALALAEEVLALEPHPRLRLYRADARANLGQAGAWEEALAVWEGTRDWNLRAEAAYLLAKLALLREDYEALEAWLGHLRRLGSPGLAEVRLKQMVCAALLRKGALQEMVAVAAQAYREAQALGYREILGVYQNFLGLAYARLGQPAQALLAYQEAYAYFAELGRVHFRAGVAINLAGLYLRFGALAQATERAKEALEVFQAIQEPRGLAESAMALGQVWLWQGQPGRAEGYFRQALAETKALPQTRLEAQADLGVALLFQNRLAEARPLLEEALQAHRPDWPLDAAWLAALALREGRLAEARARAQEALEGLEGYTGPWPQLVLWIGAQVLGEAGLAEWATQRLEAEKAELPPEFHPALEAFYQLQRQTLATLFATPPR
ncbi:ATP-binding protein [Meiothermus rufus]|uniref:ATP-binding protein n=1 Tax=Meiothermus rufus TaxID=604332 RepID=UPI00040BFFDD|nr:BTAD domain-containing putative transcriptional regulator [Meiothermus rufus]